MSRLKTIVVSLIAVGAVAGAYYAWSSSQQAKNAKGQAAQSNKAISVVTAPVQRRDFPVKLAGNGVVTSLSTVDVRPQVTSTITKVHIKEGQFVKAGDLLFSLDSRADEVNVAKAQAQLDKDLATQTDYKRQLERSKDLLSKKFVSQSVVDTSQAQYDAQNAVIASDRAAVNAAKVALSYDRITAQAAGRTGIISVYPGSLVQPGTATPLVTITQMDPISVTFTLPQRNLPDALDSMKTPDSFVLAKLPDSTAQFKGHLSFVDNTVDAASGTIRAKALFDNKELKLWPGAYANVELSVQTIKDAIVVPQDALIINAKNTTLYIVDKEGKAALRVVKVLQQSGPDAVVSGVEADVKVVLEGKQNLRPGVSVIERTDKPTAKAGGVDKTIADDIKMAPASAVSAS
ncbi:efflux RND transporter periplasmic adaptor subunit [Undibacterium terreum]|uniref:Hemolysin D n=1 Tax=Undibacterium terreum TaxID=1224302 RepID=A0A916XKS0_9BURK|nr:efflux RND transporter periplasmic adaptor subunit [Undibacterium terreum]GGC79260.1 hemolysin D [Undibacterium terreum]